MKTALHLAAILALLAMAGSALWVAHSVAQFRSDLNATQESLAASVESTRMDLAVTQAAMVNVLNKRTGEVTAEVGKLRLAVARTLKTADGTMGDLVKVRADLQPVLSNSQAVLDSSAHALDAINTLTVNITDAVNDLYPDLKAAVESATVTTTSAAQVSQDVRAVSPQITKDAQKTVKNVRRMTSWPMVLGKAIIGLPVKLIHLF